MYWPPWYCAQWTGQQYVRGPVPIGGIYSQPQWCGPPAFIWPGHTAATPPPPYAAVAPEVKEEKKEPKKEEKDKKPENLCAPPQLDRGVNYMFDTEHTMLHIFNKAAPIWEEKYHKQELWVDILLTLLSSC